MADPGADTGERKKKAEGGGYIIPVGENNLGRRREKKGAEERKRKRQSEAFASTDSEKRKEKEHLSFFSWPKGGDCRDGAERNREEKKGEKEALKRTTLNPSGIGREEGKKEGEGYFHHSAKGRGRRKRGGRIGNPKNWLLRKGERKRGRKDSF